MAGERNSKVTPIGDNNIEQTTENPKTTATTVNENNIDTNSEKRKQSINGTKHIKVSESNDTDFIDSVKSKNKKNSKETSVGASNDPKNKASTKNSKSSEISQADGKMGMERMEMCAYRPVSNKLIDIPCCGKLQEKFGCKCIIFLAIFLFEIADVISDWFLYYHVSATEEGLVYGPPSARLRYALLAFSVIGSVTFPFEVSNLWFEVFRNNPWINIDLLLAITVWFEEVPQVVINVFIFACREEAISYFQLVKASLVIIGAVIRFIVLLARYCGENARFDMRCAPVNKESRRHVVYRCFIMIGCIVTLAGATAVFLFTQSERNPDGSLNFKIPNSLIEGEYDDQKYFKNVSIYFSHEMFDSGTNLKKEDINLIKLLSINDIKQQKHDQEIKIYYDQIMGPSKVIIDATNAILGSKECFQTSTGDAVTHSTTCSSYISSTTIKKIFFKFRYIKPSIPKLIFGDISYNVKIQDGGSSCQTPAFTISDNLENHVTDSKVPTIHYFRAADDQGTHLLQTSSTSGKFYHSKHLEDVSEVWKTGFTNCESSGSKAPHYDESIPLDCT